MTTVLQSRNFHVVNSRLQSSSSANGFRESTWRIATINETRLVKIAVTNQRPYSILIVKVEA